MPGIGATTRTSSPAGGRRSTARSNSAWPSCGGRRLTAGPLRLTNLLVVRQPKLLVRASGVSPRKSPPLELELVWDPLTESLEAASCPNCQRPTMAFEYGPRNRLVCPACAMVKRG